MATHVTSRHLRSSDIFLLKLWFPFMLFLMSGALSDWWRGWRVLIALPPLTAALFFLSLAIVRAKPGKIEYRRLATWVALDPSEILSCGHPWPYIAANIRLKHFVFPWGRLYFIPDHESPFRRSKSPLVSYIQSQGDPPQSHEPQPNPTGRQSPGPGLAAAGLAGSLISLLRMYLSQPGQSVLSRPWEDVRPAWLGYVSRVELLLATPLGAAGIFGIFLTLAVLKRRKKKAWAYALVGGLALPLIFSRWLSGT
jgi:hypothetical protein